MHNFSIVTDPLKVHSQWRPHSSSVVGLCCEQFEETRYNEIALYCYRLSYYTILPCLWPPHRAGNITLSPISPPTSVVLVLPLISLRAWQNLPSEQTGQYCPSAQIITVFVTQIKHDCFPTVKCGPQCCRGLVVLTHLKWTFRWVSFKLILVVNRCDHCEMTAIVCHFVVLVYVLKRC